MPAPTTSVRLTEKNRSWADRFEGGFGTQINRDLETLEALLRYGQAKAKAVLTDKEWSYIQRIYPKMPKDVTFPANLPEGLAAAVEMGGDLTEKERGALAAKLRALHPLEALAVHELAHTWWLLHNEE